MMIWRDRKFWRKLREAGGGKGHYMFMLDGEEQWVFINDESDPKNNFASLWKFTVEYKFTVFINFGFSLKADEVKNHTLFHAPEKISVDECENILAIMALQL